MIAAQLSSDTPLDERIVAALTKSCTVEEAAAVRTAAEEALADLSAEADAADVASLSPLATRGQAEEWRGKATELRFEADRLEASVSALSVRLANLRDAERKATENIERSAARAERDRLAVEISTQYPRIVRELTMLAKRIAESDDRCAAAGILNHEGSAEAIGRGVPGNFYLPGGSPVQRIHEIRPPLPNGRHAAWTEEMGRMIWWALEL